MANQGGKDQQGNEKVDGIRHRPVDQGGHQGMGGVHGGDLHDVGSGQSGMTGRGGMGGNDNDHGKPDDADRLQSGGPGNEQRAEAGGHEYTEVQQSAQREGMGQHRGRNRDNRQALDATDADDLGSGDASAPDREKDEKPPG